MARFAYHEPRTLAEASRLLLDLGGAARFLLRAGPISSLRFARGFAIARMW